MKQKINLKNTKDIAEKLLKEKSVAVLFHIRPDGDAIGSALALYFGLNKIGIKADIFCADDIPSKFNFIPNITCIKRNLQGEYSALVALDCGEINRLGEFAEVYLKHKNTYNIDHHLSNDKYGEVNYVKSSPSNCENVYKILKELNAFIDEEIANLLYMGIMTDTGGFRHKGISGETYKIAGELVDLGADPTTNYYNCFSKQTKNRAKLYGLVMKKIRYFLDGKLAIASILESDIEESKAHPSETEGFIDFIMGIDGVEVGVCLLETAKNKFKISFRGKDTDVNLIAGYFGGGGHKFASGCQIQGEYEEVIDKLHYAVKVHIKE